MFTKKRGVCFSCVGMGMISKCPPGRCLVEKEMLLTEKAMSVGEIGNRLGSLVRDDMRGMKACVKCYLPAPKDGGDNEFHPNGMGPGGDCYVFKAVANKALACGATLWLQMMRGGEAATQEDDDLSWLVDLIKNTRGSPEVSMEGFARILKSTCGNGDWWYMRILYHMIKQAVREDEKISI
jgi:hypothetical protein